MRNFFFIIIATCLFSTSHAAPADDLTTLLNAVRTMRAQFIQTVYDNHHKPIQESKGRMDLERPGKFRWEVTAPIPQVVIANGERLWIYDPDLEQVTIRSLKKSAGDTPALLLSDVDAVLTSAYVVKVGPSKDMYTLVPKSADNMFASIQLTFANNQIREMRLEDHLGHVTAIKFQQIKTNVSLPASLFVFKQPANVDIIDETRETR